VQAKHHPRKWADGQFYTGMAFFLHAEMTESKIAIGDLEGAISRFDAAIIGYESSGMENELEDARNAKKQAENDLERLRATEKE
jgi:hypothetical protein